MKKTLTILVALFIVIVIGTAAVLLLTNKKGNVQGQGKVQPQNEFSDGQPYSTYSDDHFSANYPNWPKIDVSLMPSAGKIKVAVLKQGCSLFIKVNDFPATSTLEIYTDNAIHSFGNNLKVNQKEVNGNSGLLDAEIITSTGATARNISHAYIIDKSIYSIAMVAEKSNFSKVCAPMLDEVIASVKIK